MMKIYSYTLKKIFFAGVFLLIRFTCISQDFHLSQYDANPLYLNPALTGLRENDNWNYRLNTNYRQQWNVFTKRTFATSAIGLDLPISNKFSLGEFVTNNESAGGLINTLNLMSSVAYNITNKNSGGDIHNLSVGFQLGLLQKSLNPANLVFDSQYSPSDPNVFDQHLPNGENFTQANIFNLDANFGVYYKYTGMEGRFAPFIGFSIYHLTTPNESFTGAISKTPMRFVIHGGSSYSLGKNLSIHPQWLYMSQAKASELNLGILFFYKIKTTDFEPMIGFAMRNDDAVIFQLGLKHKIGIFRISYDITTSYLKQYNNGGGGLEFSAIFTGRKKNTAQQKPSDNPPAKQPIKGEF